MWITSDQHFGHSNIIKYEKRPFETVEDMDWIMVGNWNEVVKKSDKIFHLGDFSFYNKEKTKRIVEVLKGYKVLILGNHDDRSVNWFLDVGFQEVIKYPIIYKQFYIMSHEPLYLNENMPYVNIHGHIHSKSYDSKQYYNVSVEKTDYKPVNFQDILDYYKMERSEE